MPASLESFATLATGYDAVLSDVWGVIHNGVTATPEPCDALMRFRAKGGTVVLITNAPRPGAVGDASSSTSSTCRARPTTPSSAPATSPAPSSPSGRARTSSTSGRSATSAIFEGLDLHFVPLEQADYVVCTGLTDDEAETPESYRALLTKVRERKPVHGLRQSRPGGRARRQAGLLRRRDRRPLRRARRRGALRRQAASADLPRVSRPESRRCAAASRRARACWRSAIRCAPISPAPPGWGSTACS